MSEIGRAARMFAGAVVLTGLLVGCGRGAQPLAVTGLPPAVPPREPPAATTKFQGAVASVDAGSRTMVVDVTIVWTPVFKADAHQRRVLLPASMGLIDLIVGGEVQVEALDEVDGVWPAVAVQLLDIE